jgi:hypothetical protein
MAAIISSQFDYDAQRPHHRSEHRPPKRPHPLRGGRPPHRGTTGAAPATRVMSGVSSINAYDIDTSIVFGSFERSATWRRAGVLTSAGGRRAVAPSDTTRGCG